MVAPARRQSVAGAQRELPAQLERVNQTGRTETITVDGHVRGALLSPTAYDALVNPTEFTDEA